MAEIILEINGLTKKYGGFTAVDNLNLKIYKGQVFGILGPNGSGKTTTLGMVLGVINESAGSFSWFGKAPFENHRKRIGSILEHPIFYPDLSAQRNLEISSAIKGASKDRIEVVLKRVGLFERKESKFKSYSLGMKQRLALASALLSNPDVLVLDEPTNGLDPEGINEMRNLINGIAKEGKTIIISSHLLDEIQKTCSHVAILKNGKLLSDGPIGALMNTGNSFVIASGYPEIENLAAKFDWISSVEPFKGKYKITCDTSKSAGDINEIFMSEGIILSHIESFKVSLEDEFLNIVKG